MFKGKQPMKFLRNIVLHNIALKLISLLLAVLTWSYVGMQLYKEAMSADKESPSIIKVSGEKLIVKTLPIYANIEGTPATGYQLILDKISISPPHSVIAGHTDAIKDLSYITTEPVVIEGSNSTIRKDVKLASIPNCKIGYDGFVRVTVPIARIKHR
jgi:hypothetical protein